MWLPTKAQVDAASRHAITAAGTAIAIFGLQAKGIDPAQLTAIIQSLGSVVNDVVILLATVAPFYAMIKASHSASPTSQSIAVASAGALVVTSPEIAAATPNQPNIVSNQDVKVTPK